MQKINKNKQNNEYVWVLFLEKSTRKNFEINLFLKMQKIKCFKIINQVNHVLIK